MVFSNTWITCARHCVSQENWFIWWIRYRSNSPASKRPPEPSEWFKDNSIIWLWLIFTWSDDIVPTYRIDENSMIQHLQEAHIYLIDFAPDHTYWNQKWLLNYMPNLIIAAPVNSTVEEMRKQIVMKHKLIVTNGRKIWNMLKFMTIDIAHSTLIQIKFRPKVTIQSSRISIFPTFTSCMHIAYREHWVKDNS